MIADFSLETMEARKKWQSIFSVQKKQNHQPRILYPVKMSFSSKGAIKTFSYKGKLREFVTSRPTSKMAKGSSLNRKETIKKGNLEHQEEEKT